MVLMAVALLNNTTHAADAVTSTFQAIFGVYPAQDHLVYADQSSNDSTYTSLPEIAADRKRINYSILTDKPANHALYRVLSNAFEPVITNYPLLVANDVLNVWPYVRVELPGMPPQPFTPVIGNVFQGLTGDAVEVGIAPGYRGLDTSTASSVTAVFATLIAIVMAEHPRFKACDIQAMFRQTAANWSTGYDPANYGYGILDADAANNIQATSAIFLQPPMFDFVTQKKQKVNGFLTLQPFRQSRRVTELVYFAPADYAWPMKDEYSASDLAASGAVLAYDNAGGGPVTNLGVPLPATPGTYDAIAFTTDGAGNFSRVDSFIPRTFSV
jgi:hypothetical protein